IPDARLYKTSPFSIFSSRDDTRTSLRSSLRPIWTTSSPGISRSVRPRSSSPAYRSFRFTRTSWTSIAVKPRLWISSMPSRTVRPLHAKARPSPDLQGPDRHDRPQPPTRGPGTPGRFPRGGIRDLAGRGGPTRTVSQELVRGQPFSAEPLCDEGGAGRGAGRHPGHGRNLDAGDRRGVPGVGRGAEENRGRRRKGSIPSRARGPESERLRNPHHGV